MIHPTAIIHPKAKLDSTVQVGPYAVIDESVELGVDCIVGPHVYITGDTVIGARNHFFAGSVIGEAPQDSKYRGEPTGLRIGTDNLFREHVTVNRAAKVGEFTYIGSNNFLMAGCHIAHNCVIGDRIIIANASLLGGHVTVGDRAFVAGGSLIHQFVRIGGVTMTQGGTRLTQDLPPYTVGCHVNQICGLNVLGLRRAGFSDGERLEMKQLYHILFRCDKNMREAVTGARDKFASPKARELIEFVATSKRGVCSDVSREGLGTEQGGS